MTGPTIPGAVVERVENVRREIADRLTPNALYEADYESEWTRRTLGELADIVAAMIRARAATGEAEPSDIGGE